MSTKAKVKKLEYSVGKIDVKKINSQLSSYEYVSFDIFDTLIKRNVNEPKDIFKIMELSIGNDFYSKRIRAEHKARKNTSEEEVTLREIYTYFPKDDREMLAQLELEFEFSAIVPNIPMIEVYHNCVAAGKKIFIVTDMYWSIEIIKKLLRKVGVESYDKIYLSSEQKKTKRNGTLFKVLLEEQNIRPKELIHIGDHIKSDYIVPIKLGIHAIQIPQRDKSIYFRHKSDVKIQNNYLNSLIKNTCPRGKGNYYEFGYSQFGKLLWGYSKWIYRMASERNIQKLFFFARDGWIMKQAYDICINDSSIKTNYLEVSRRSLRCPILWIDFNYDKVLDMVVNAKLVSIKSIFDGLGLNMDRYTTELNKCNIKKDALYDRDTIYENKAVRNLIFLLKDDIIENSKKEYEALSKYLERNGVFGKIGIVDIGYAGSMQRYLQQALTMMGVHYEIYGFYLGVADYYKKNDSLDNLLDLNGYLFDFKHNKNAVDTRSSYVGLFETLFLEQAGSVMKYINKENGVEVERYPYEYYQNGSPTDEFVKIKLLQQGALDFVSLITKDTIVDTFEFSVDDLFYGIYETGTNPRKYELDLFSEIEFYDEGIKTKLAAPRKWGYYICHIQSLKNDFLLCRWKIGFMKKCFKIKLPYQMIYSKMKKVEKL